MEKKRWTIKEAAAAALAVQNACNLSGVVYDWALAMDAVCDESHRLGKGTDWKNTHPVNVLFASKVGDLAGAELCGFGSYVGIPLEIFKEARKLAELDPADEV